MPIVSAISSSQRGRRSPWEEAARKHLPQIRLIASSISARYRPDVELDDLVSAGFIGLLDALEKFDESKGIQFKTYAEFRIRGAILDRLRKLDPVPKWLRQKGKEIEKTFRRLEQRLGRAVGLHEVAREMGLESTALQEMLGRLSARNIPLAEPGEEEEDGVVDAQLVSQEPTPFQSCYRREVREMLQREIASLSEREQLVLSLRYQEDLSMKEIGEILGLHQSRISQLHRKALNALRGLLPPCIAAAATA